MAQNLIPDTYDSLLALAEDMVDGLNAYGASIGVLQNTEPVMQAAITATQTAQAAFKTAGTNLTEYYSTQRAADSTGRAAIGMTKMFIAQQYGSEWSDQWLETGFPNNSLAIPATIQERQTLLQSLSTFLAANPSFENAPANVTSAFLLNYFNSLSGARSQVNNGKTLVGQGRNARDVAEKALRKRMRGLIDELDTLLSETDPRWEAFGLNPPGASQTPDAPVGLVLTKTGAATANASWQPTARAEHYRVWKKAPGDADYIAVQTVYDTAAMLTGLPATGTVSVRITAVNDGGEGVPGNAVDLVM